MALLELKNIYAGYGKREVLHGISLKVDTGDLTAVIGPNGSGKSTLLKVIAGLLTPTDGSLIFDSESIIDLPVHKRMNSGISYLIQGGKIFPSLTVEENIELGQGNLNSQQDQVDFEELLELFQELKPLLNRRAGLLSGGERQMLALAMIMGYKPQLLLLDEPSAGLSPKLVKELFEKIRVVKERWDNAIILVEQNVRNVLNVANNAITLVDGNIIDATENPIHWLKSKTLDKYFIGD